MKAILFKNPVIGQLVIFTNSMGVVTRQRIVEVTPKAIRISSCNLLKFNRNGLLCKKDWFNKKCRPFIKPTNE